ncbi:hypothetical protein OG455_03380 [Kitasatospora sp. NBC_01287]|uniref:hypothetical protein n=1 Tax=Kitasatospora sp. NBC_01287 TaxID=2903573 RepID=UPI00224F76BB|nr:hypothetical protein [Kitasatospora sp. NBC_01287]MCX4744571.1 hypothetical protein [Kitasatospora sp. NBC_01287]
MFTAPTRALALPVDLIALQQALLAADRAVGDFALAVRDRRRAAFPEPSQAVQRCTRAAGEETEFDRRWEAYVRAGAAVREHPVLVRARVLGVEAEALCALREAAARPVG